MYSLADSTARSDVVMADTKEELLNVLDNYNSHVGVSITQLENRLTSANQAWDDLSSQQVRISCQYQSCLVTL